MLHINHRNDGMNNYGNPSYLFYNNELIMSTSGCQQGDPLGPALFSLAIHDKIKSLSSSLNLWYLDDGTIAGKVDTIISDLNILIPNLKETGLYINSSKSEIYFNPNLQQHEIHDMANTFQNLLPNFKTLNNENLFLLGAPILQNSLRPLMLQKQQKLEFFKNQLLNITPHVSLILLRNCFSMPRLTYFLRSCPFWLHTDILYNMDQKIKTSLEEILNISFNNNSWFQATLPIRLGGLGLRCCSDVALPAFLASIHKCNTLLVKVLNPSILDKGVCFLSESNNEWRNITNSTDLPIHTNIQKFWDLPLLNKKINNFINTLSNTDKARMLAAQCKESGAWLEALPSPSLATLLDRQTVRIAVSLRIGAPICQPHYCICGTAVTPSGHHGLSCRLSAGRISRHNNINNVIKRSLASAGIPSTLEPVGLDLDDGKRPDGVTIVPWYRGRALIWDATCVDTLAPSYSHVTSRSSGAAALLAQNKKNDKYKKHSSSYEFLAFSVETLGPWSPDAIKFGSNLGKLLIDASGDHRARSYFFQRISLEIQRGNALCILGTCAATEDLQEIFNL